MNDILRNVSYQLYRVASSDTQTTFTIAAVALLVVGYFCLRGNVIKK